MNRTIRMVNGKVFGFDVSAYGKEKGYLDYRTLAKMLEGIIPNNIIRAATMTDWIIVSGTFKEMVKQDFIISKYAKDLLEKYTDELVFYNPKLDIYIWAVTKWESGFAYELTDVELEAIDDEKTERDSYYDESYLTHVYNVVAIETSEMDAIYKDYILKLVGTFGFNALFAHGLLESCGAVDGRSLYVLCDKRK